MIIKIAIGSIYMLKEEVFVKLEKSPIENLTGSSLSFEKLFFYNAALIYIQRCNY